MSVNTFQQQIQTYKTGLRRSASVVLSTVGDNEYVYNFKEAGGDIQHLTMVVGGMTGANLTDTVSFAAGVNGVYDIFQTITVDGAAANVSAVVEMWNLQGESWVMKVTSEDPVNPPSITYKTFTGKVNSLRMTTPAGGDFTQGTLAVFTEIIV
jgi:hypothetical protein